MGENVRQESLQKSLQAILVGLVSQPSIETSLTTKRRSALDCESTFKKPFANHKSSFSHERYKNSILALSNEVWQIKHLNGIPHITWRITGNASVYSPEAKRCALCLCEKFEIANYPGQNLLSKRTEIIAKCCHRSNLLLLQGNVT